MRTWISAFGICLAILAMAGCSIDGVTPGVTTTTTPSATVSFNLTDAPMDSRDVKSVFVKFGGLKINESSTAAETAATWIDVPIDATKEYDLLSLSSGTTALLGNIGMTPGTQINQIRFVDPTIEVVETSAPTVRLPCTLSSSTGLKIVNAFAVPLTGALTLTVDFDVRKSLVYSQGQGYKMKPVLRAVVEGAAGNIAGAFADGYVVYAYKDGTYSSTEETADAVTGVIFGNSVTSAKPVADSAGIFKYKLAFLEAGTYDLVVVNLSTNAVDSSTYANVVVASGTSTAQDIVTATSSTAKVTFNLTDAPVDSANIASVFVKFSGLKINESSTAAETAATWIDVPIDATKEYDLLSLSSGTTALLGNVSMTPGTQVNQIRFLDPTIEIVETSDLTARKACALTSSTGLKIVNAFAVPLTGSLTLTVDFDVRKSLVITGGQGGTKTYKMKPVLRAVVEGAAGNIAGAMADGYVVYAYKDGSYASTEETADPVSGVVFGNSVTSAKPVQDSAGAYKYKLAFLEAGTYDLVVVNLSTNAVDSTSYVDKVVVSSKSTSLDIAVLP